ncbi:MAG TPA: hypothetical protein VF257_11655 [Solirubrobacteraceae bacterium]
MDGLAAASAAADTATTPDAPALAPHATASGPSWILLLGAAAAGAAFVALVLRLYDAHVARRARRAAVESEAPVQELPGELFWPPTRAQPRERPPQPRPADRVRPSLVVIPPQPERSTRHEPSGAAPTDSRREPSGPAPSRHGPVCQVRWSRRAERFYAVMTDPDGAERRLARSPRIDWRGLSPPDEDSREAQSAVRQLAKELRANGWRPLRAKGVDYDERRWYARRFRWVAEAEQDSPHAGAPPREHAPTRRS